MRLKSLFETPNENDLKSIPAPEHNWWLAPAEIFSRVLLTVSYASLSAANFIFLSIVIVLNLMADQFERILKSQQFHSTNFIEMVREQKFEFGDLS